MYAYDAACALVEFKVKRTTGHPTIKWAGSGIVDGVTRGLSKNGVAELRYANYLQNSGIRPGRNTFDFQVGQEGSARVSELRIFSEDSGIEYTPLSPANVKLDARLASKTSVRVGQRFTVRFTLRNDGERTARKIHVSADYGPRELSLVRAQLRRASRNCGRVARRRVPSSLQLDVAETSRSSSARAPPAITLVMTLH